MATRSPEISRRPQRKTRIIGFRLPAELTQSVKDEAGKRGIPLNRLFEDMWELYQKNKIRKA